MNASEVSILPSYLNKNNMRGSTTATPHKVNSLEDVHILVQKENWSPSLFKENYRNKNNFLKCFYFGVDIDENLSVEDAIERLTGANLNYSITFTTSHQIKKNGKESCDRFRIIIPLEIPIEDIATFYRYANYLKTIFPEADKACFDPARFFLASKGKVSNPNSDYYLCTNCDNLYIADDDNITQKAMITEQEQHGYDHFLKNAPSGLPGEWNNNLNKTVFLLAKSGLDQNTIIRMIQEIAPMPLDHNDLATISSAIRGSSESYPRKLKSSDYYKLTFESLKILLKDKVHFVEDKSGIKVPLEEMSNGVVKYISEEKVISIISNIFYNTKLFDGPAKMKKVAENYKNLSDPLEKNIYPVAFLKTQGLTFHRLDFSPEVKDTPLFDELMSRTSNEMALRAFIWSIFETKSDRQQYLWIYGEGSNGKGTLARFLEKCLGETYCTENTNGSKNNRFFTSAFLGKRLAVFSDINSRNFVISSVFKELTGEDLIKIEQKGKAPFTAKIHTKFMLLSNNFPNLSSQKSDLRRIILCEVSPLIKDIDPTYESKLWAERAGILHKCYQAYQELTRNHGPIQSENTLAKDIAEDSELPFRVLFNSILEFNKESSITPEGLYSNAFNECKIQGISFTSFKKWILRQNGISQSRIDGKRRINGVRLKLLHKNF